MLCRVIDGDTFKTSSNENIRLIGIDTPEKDNCGTDEVTRALKKLLSNGLIVFYDGATSDRVKYDRTLRYSEVDGVDAGLQLNMADTESAPNKMLNEFQKIEF